MSFELEIESSDEQQVDQPERIVLYGPPGVGKTTFAASAPKPFILDLDKGSKRVTGVHRNKRPITTWADLISAVRWFHDKKHEFETFVLDTVDRAQNLCHEHVVRTIGGKNGKIVKSISEVGGGFGVGYTIAAEEFRNLYGDLERLWSDRNMRIIILAHSKLETVKNPSGFDYQRNTLNAHNTIASMLMEVSDVVMYASLKVSVQKDGLYDGKRARAIGGEARYLHCVETPSIVAKNRLGLPERIPLSWDEFVGHATRSGTLLEDTIKEKARRIDAIKGIAKVLPWAIEEIKSGRSERTKLIQILSKLSAKLDELESDGESKSEEQPTTN